MVIKNIKTIKVVTKYGNAEKHLLTIEKDGKTVQADSFVGEWNRDWTVGTVLPEDIQWAKREYEGRTYWSIKAPEIISGHFESSGIPNDISKTITPISPSANLNHRVTNLEGKLETLESVIDVLYKKAKSEESMPVVEYSSPQKKDENKKNKN